MRIDDAPSAAELAAALEREQRAREDAERQRVRARRLVAEAVAAEERERGRLAQGLHDGPVQNLLAAQIELRRAAAAADVDLDRPLGAIAESITELRAAIFALHPLTLEQFGLGHAVEQLANDVGRHHEVTIRLDIPSHVPKSHESMLYALIRELMTNAARHAGATSIAVRVRVGKNAVELEVEDDGAGLTDERRRSAVRQGHIGLISSQERVEALGGKFAVSSIIGSGTTVLISLPSRRASDFEPARPQRAARSGERRGLAV